MSPEAPLVPRVFISYSQESEPHKDRVLRLANRLVREGIDVILDRYQPAPSEGWSRWMRDGIDESKFVLVICTQTYQLRAYGREPAGQGLGVNREGSIIDQAIYENAGRNLKFIAVVFTAADRSFVPDFLASYQTESVETEADYLSLYRRLTNQPEIARPEPGPLRSLPSRQIDPPKTRGSAGLSIDPMRAAVLFNRSGPTNRLQEFIMAPENAGRANRPLAFIVSGPETEFPELLHDRLLKYTLPKRMLGLRENADELRGLELPDRATDQSIRAAFDWALDAAPPPNSSSIVDRIPPGLTYFRAEIQVTGNLPRSEANKIDALLRFLNDRNMFPDTPPEKAVSVGISIVRETGNGPSERQLIRRFPEEDYPNLRFKVLPVLGSPCRTDVRNWVDVVNTIAGGLPLEAREALRQAAVLLFGAGQCIPMRDWYNGFEKLRL